MVDGMPDKTDTSGTYEAWKGYWGESIDPRVRIRVGPEGITELIMRYAMSVALILVPQLKWVTTWKTLLVSRTRDPSGMTLCAHGLISFTPLPNVQSDHGSRDIWLRVMIFTVNLQLGLRLPVPLPVEPVRAELLPQYQQLRTSVVALFSIGCCLYHVCICVSCRI